MSEIWYIKDMEPFKDPKSDIQFCMLVPKSTYIPGDERSRTDPGHGYPAETQKSWDLLAFENQTDWEDEISARTLAGKDFVPFKMIRPEVSISTEVEVDIDV